MGSALDYAQHLAIDFEHQTIFFPHPKRLWRVFLSPSPRRRVFWCREGDFVRGGRFCTPSQAVPGTTPTVSPSCGDRFFLPPKSRKRPGSFEIYAHRAHSDKTYPRTVVGSDATDGLVTSIRSPASSRCRICAIELRKRFIFDSE